MVHISVHRVGGVHVYSLAHSLLDFVPRIQSTIEFVLPVHGVLLGEGRGCTSVTLFFRFKALAKDTDKRQTVRKRLLRYLFKCKRGDSAVAEMAVEFNSALLVAWNAHDRRMALFLG